MRRTRESGLQPEVQQELVKLLRRLMQDVDAKRYFNEAVDPDALGIPEYREIIKEPMDLGLIFWKLKDQTYKDLPSFFADLHLVWRNCQTFNLQESAVHSASEKLSTSFQTWWARARRTLKLEGSQFEFPYRPPSRAAPEPKPVPEVEGTRSRRLIVKKTFDDAASSQLLASAMAQPKVSASRLKIKLGKGTKREHGSHHKKSASLFGKSKERSIDPETIKQLETCISILNKLSHNSHAAVLEQATLQPSFVPSITEICASLREAQDRQWVQSPYGSSKDVLHEAGLYLRSQAVKNEHRRKIVAACQGLLKSLEKLWVDAGFGQDVESLRGTHDDTTESGRLPDSNLRVTKARVEKLKRQEMEKEVKEAEEAISQLEKAKATVEHGKERLDKAKEALKEASRNWNSNYRGKLNRLTELGKQKGQLQKQKEKTQTAIKASQVAVERYKQKEAALQVLKEEESRAIEALEQEQSKLAVFPRDASLVDVRHYSKKQKTEADMSDAYLMDLGNFWLSMAL